MQKEVCHLLTAKGDGIHFPAIFIYFGVGVRYSGLLLTIYAQESFLVGLGAILETRDWTWVDHVQNIHTLSAIQTL